MIGEDGSSLEGVFSFFTFALSVIAAVMAIDMYALLRTGEFGKTWRVLIIASVMLALSQALRVAGLLNWKIIQQTHLAEVAQMAFVIMLAYAFHLQRTAFANRTIRMADGTPLSGKRVPARRASDFFGPDAETDGRNASLDDQTTPKRRRTDVDEEAGDERDERDERGDNDDIEWDSQPALSAPRVDSSTAPMR